MTDMPIYYASELNVDTCLEIAMLSLIHISEPTRRS